LLYVRLMVGWVCDMREAFCYVGVGGWFVWVCLGLLRWSVCCGFSDVSLCC